MRTIIFLLLSLSIPVLAFGQNTITINCTNTVPAGAVFTPPDGYGFQNNHSGIHVGKPFAKQPTIGRGYLEFNLNSLTSAIISSIMKVELVFESGAASNDQKHTVKVSDLRAPNLNPGLSPDAEYAYKDLNSSYNISLGTINLEKLSVNQKITINKDLIGFYWTPNPHPTSPGNLSICLVHAKEDSVGIVTSAKLVITHYVPPSAPTNLRISNVTQTGCTLSWNASTTGPTTKYRVYNGSTLLKGNITATSTVITDLSPNTPYNLCVKAENPAGVSACSNAVQFPPPVITGPTEVCYSGSVFTLNNAPTGSTITWSVSAPFTVSGSGTTATVTRKGTGTGRGTLTAIVNGVAVATKTVTPCPPPTISGPAEVCYAGSIFTLSGVPAGAGTITWSVSHSHFTVSGSGATATVTRTGTGSSRGTLTAKINGTAVATKTITPCPPITISGADACPSTVYRLQNGWATSWSVEPTGVFTITASNPGLASVSVTNPNGQTGTLTAVVNGISFTRAIQACIPAIAGPDVIWDSYTGYFINTRQGATWSVSGDFSVNPASGVQTTVIPDGYNGQTGTLTATVNGTTLTKTVQAGYGHTYVEAELHLSSSLSGNSPAIKGTLFVETARPGQLYSYCQSVVQGYFPNNGYSTYSSETEIKNGEYFTECEIEIDPFPIYCPVSYYVTVEVFERHSGQSVHFTEYEGTTSGGTDYVGMLGSGWDTSIYPGDSYRMVVTCHIADEDQTARAGFKSMAAGGRSAENRPAHGEIPAEWEVAVYPNPTDGLLRVDISGGDIPQGAMIEIFAASGAVAGKWTDISSVNTLDISAQPAGTYLVRIMMDRENVCVKKIVKN